MYARTGKNADPEFCKERARLASRAAHSIERYSDDDLIDALVRRAPALDENTSAKLRALLADSNGGRADG